MIKLSSIQQIIRKKSCQVKCKDFGQSEKGRSRFLSQKKRSHKLKKRNS